MGRALGSGRCCGREAWMGTWAHGHMVVPRIPEPLVLTAADVLRCPLDRSGLCSDNDTDLETVCRLSDPSSSQNGRFSSSFAERVTPSGTVSDDVGSALRADASGQGTTLTARYEEMLYGCLCSKPRLAYPGTDCHGLQ